MKREIRHEGVLHDYSPTFDTRRTGRYAVLREGAEITKNK